MRTKFLLPIFFVLFSLSFVFGQVVADFETGTDGFDVGWGNAITNVYQTADPTGTSGGVLALDFDASASESKGAVAKTNIDATGAKVITFFVYLPAGVPDSILIKVWAQDNSWTWFDFKTYAVDVPKEVWYPLSFDLERAHAMNADFDVAEGPIQKMGLEFGVWDLSGDDLTYTGTFYVDNVSLLGVLPVTVADFETGTDGYGIAWGDFITNLSTATDPAGVNGNSLALSLDAAATTESKGAIAKTNLDVGNAQLITTYIYLPSGTPDSILIKTWAQDNDWTWLDFKYYAGDIPKDVWYPLHFDMKAAHALNSAWDASAGPIQKFGLEFGTWDLKGDSKTWSGTVYVDNVLLQSTEVAKKWVFAGFEKEAGGTQGFSNTGWNKAITNLARVEDPTGRTQGVLLTDWDFSLDVKASFSNGNVNFGWADTAGVDTGATEIDVDVWLPADFPMDSTMQLSIFVQDHDTWSWTEEKYVVGSTLFKPGDWTTISYDIVSRVNDGKVNPFAGATVGIQIYDMSESSTWTGTVYWDNFTLVGVEEPKGTLVSPKTIAAVDTVETAVVSYQVVHIQWVDNKLGSETYKVYMSKSPITDLSDEGVIQIARDIPHGTEYWNFRPFTKEPETTTLYFAVTAVGPDGEETPLTDDSKVGPVTLTSSATAKAYYVENFSDSFVLDGLDTEFEPYKEYQIKPESAGGPEEEGWDYNSTDMMWNAIFVIDADYLYISAKVTDDDLNATGSDPIVGGQAWMGDALEFYMGFYDLRNLKAYHGYKDVMNPGTADYRISFTVWGEVQSASAKYDFPGLESTIFQSFTGDGYIIEARIALDSLALDGNIDVTDGFLFPLRIDGTDLDPSHGDESRTLITQWGGMGGNTEDWLRPSSWGLLEVINGPTAVDEVAGTVRSFKLYDNYPNPFNPSTNIRFDLPKTTDVHVEIFNILGQKVRTLVNKKMVSGTHTVTWDGKDDRGNTLSSGIYLLKFRGGEFSASHKMVLLK
ncbi:MAG: T9SS type A sorting domain-containing protein [Calditrichaeota bacterium]|nr:T9SS type A sorting domain-containing protein [Calditrichota bacterium]